jgi:hypothetical protein
MIFWLVLKLEFSYNGVVISLEGFWVLLEDCFFEDYVYFCMVKYFEFP